MKKRMNFSVIALESAVYPLFGSAFTFFSLLDGEAHVDELEAFL